MAFSPSSSKAPNVFLNVSDGGGPPISSSSGTSSTQVFSVSAYPVPPTPPVNHEIFVGKSITVPLLLGAESNVFYSHNTTSVPIIFNGISHVFYSNNVTDVPLTLDDTSNVFYSHNTTSVPIVVNGISHVFYANNTANIPITISNKTSTLFYSPTTITVPLALNSGRGAQIMLMGGVSGTNIVDTIGHTMTVTGDVSTDGTIITFGSNPYSLISTPYLPLSIYGNWTVEGYFSVNSYQQWEALYWNGPNARIRLYDTYPASISIGGNSVQYLSGFPYTGNMYHLAVCMIGTTATVYINGQLSTTFTNVAWAEQPVVTGAITTFGQAPVSAGVLEQAQTYGTATHIKVIAGTALYTSNFTPEFAVPVANFSGTPTSGTTPLIVNFTDLSSNVPTSWLWNFGDGNTSTLQNPTHSYASAGTYTVTLIATNWVGSHTKISTSYITTQNPLMTVTSNAPFTQAQNTTRTFRISNAPFVSGTPYTWTALVRLGVLGAAPSVGSTSQGSPYPGEGPWFTTNIGTGTLGSGGAAQFDVNVLLLNIGYCYGVQVWFNGYGPGTTHYSGVDYATTDANATLVQITS